MLFTEKSSFKEYLFQELEQDGSSLSLNVKSYLVELLCLYLSSDQLFIKKEGESKSYENTLTELYKKSLDSKPQEKLCIFKRMGDFSLYLSGFFRLAIQKKIVHISYYEQMGQSAYGFISSSYGTRPNVFKELSQKFPQLSQILFSIQKKSEIQDTRYLLNFSNTNCVDLEENKSVEKLN